MECFLNCWWAKDLKVESQFDEFLVRARAEYCEMLLRR
jgi:hypothetical protein